MDKGKRAKVDEEDGSELDAELVQAIEKLQEVQDELERVSYVGFSFVSLEYKALWVLPLDVDDTSNISIFDFFIDAFCISVVEMRVSVFWWGFKDRFKHLGGCFKF